MNILILASPDSEVKKVADRVAQGAQELKAEVSRATIGKDKPNLEPVEFVFLGCKIADFSTPQVKMALSSLGRKNAAFFFVTNKPDPKAVEAALQTAQKTGVNVKGAFTASLDGPLSFLGLGAVKEADLIRARGFGERTLNVAFGLPFGGESEKNRIKGYQK